ncbi:MAG: hypothetical protein WBA91_12325, partial [Paracoccaceae bacterium]
DAANSAPFTQISGTMRFDAAGIVLDDPGLGAALGPAVTGSTEVDWRSGQPVDLRQLVVQSGDLRVAGDLGITHKGLDPVFSGDLTLDAANMARFSGLAGRKLGGAARIKLSGRLQALSGAFDLAGRAQGQGLSVDQSMLDRLLAHESEIEVAARRDREGLNIDQLRLTVPGIRATATGRLTDDLQDIEAALSVDDLAALGAGFGGQLSTKAQFIGPPGKAILRLAGQAEDLTFGFAILAPLFRGPSEFTLSAAQEEGHFHLQGLSLKNANLTAEAAPAPNGDGYAVTADLRSLSVIAPELSGPASLSGRVRPTAKGYDLTASANGPGGSQAQLGGTLAADFASADLALSGNSQAALLNPLLAPRTVKGPVNFDLNLRGPLSLNTLGGTVTVSNLGLSSPADRIAVSDGVVQASLANGQAVLDGWLKIRGGGRVTLSGPIALAPPYDGALQAELNKVRITDPDLFDTTLSGGVTIDGPLLGGATIGGALVLHETEISVTQPAYGGAVTLPITHKNDSAAVRRTRSHSG